MLGSSVFLFDGRGHRGINCSVISVTSCSNLNPIQSACVHNVIENNQLQQLTDRRRNAMKRALIAALAVLLGLASMSAARMANSQPTRQSEQDRVPQFGGIVVIKPKSDPKEGAVLEKTELRRMGSGTFLVGTATGASGKWYRGQTVWFAVDDINMMVEYADLDTYNKLISK
jgi:hypothetical protein